MTQDRKEPDELNIVISEQVQEAMKKDPELAKELTELFACMRQARHALQEGRYQSFDEAMEAITGKRPEKIEMDELPDDDE